MWTFVAFAALGFLIGNLAGLSATSVTTSLLGLLFAFGGGSAIAFLRDTQSEDRKRASQAILALSISCVTGIYAGIYTSEQQLLTRDKKVAASRLTSSDRKYLRASATAAAIQIDQRHSSGLATPQAFEALIALSGDLDQKTKSIKEQLSRDHDVEQAYQNLLAVFTGEVGAP